MTEGGQKPEWRLTGRKTGSTGIWSEQSIMAPWDTSEPGGRKERRWIKSIGEKHKSQGLPRKRRVKKIARETGL